MPSDWSGCHRAISAALVCALLTLPVASRAQLYGNVIPSDVLAQQNGNVWFGSVRDSRGRFLADATVVLDTGNIEYLALSDRDGRFRLLLPTSVDRSAVQSRCSRPDHGIARIRIRPPRSGATSPIEMSCVLD